MEPPLITELTSMGCPLVVNTTEYWLLSSLLGTADSLFDTPSATRVCPVPRETLKWPSDSVTLTPTSSLSERTGPLRASSRFAGSPLPWPLAWKICWLRENRGGQLIDLAVVMVSNWLLMPSFCLFSSVVTSSGCPGV